jgi:hypothetical protein
MHWLVILDGKHWGDISPVVFHEHHRNKDWCMLLCDAVDASGTMTEISRGDMKIYVPEVSVVAAVHIQDPRQTLGFIDPKMVEGEAPE